ncbi:MAG: peptidoglycan-binding protein [Oscillospiraceae bacterium]|nr:peptidoglycan-binding protein [Oscillospiraceae bacterium]
MAKAPAENKYPGIVLKPGSSGPEVEKIQTCLNVIGTFYPAVPPLNADSVFGAVTERAVSQFQRLFGLLDDGRVGRQTWNAVFSACYRLQEAPLDPGLYPGFPLQKGDRGSNVSLLQSYLSLLAQKDRDIPPVAIDGRYGSATERAVFAFQRQSSLPATGVVDRSVWDAIIRRARELAPDWNAAPGHLLRFGSTGFDVVTAQNCLNTVHSYDAAVPRVVVDGRYGAATENAVELFQRKYELPADGILGPQAWDVLMRACRGPAEPPAAPEGYAGVPLAYGSFGSEVQRLQAALNRLRQSQLRPFSAALKEDGRFGSDTERAVLAFQQTFGLRADGIVGRESWRALAHAQHETVGGHIAPAPQPPKPSLLPDDPEEYPGTPLGDGAEGPAVTLLQSRLNEVGDHYHSIPRLAEDGKYGENTMRAVFVFQRIFFPRATGVAGEDTWKKLMEVSGQLRSRAKAGL